MRVFPLVRKYQDRRCVVLPGAGGGVQPYLRLASFLGRSHDVYAVAPLGLLAGETPQDDVPAMAGTVLGALDEAFVEPDLVFGWSMGGTLGWEVATALAGRDRRPDLVLVDVWPFRRPSTPQDDGRVEAEIRRGLGPNAAGPVVDRVLAVFRGQVAALARHEASTSYAGRVLLLVCTGDAGKPGYERTGSVEALDRWRSLAPDLRVGELAAGHFEVFEPARHPALVTAVADFLGVPDEVTQ